MYIKILFYVEQKCLFYQDMWKKYLILVAFILGKKKQFLNNILQFFFLWNILRYTAVTTVKFMEISIVGKLDKC